MVKNGQSAPERWLPCSVTTPGRKMYFVAYFTHASPTFKILKKICIFHFYVMKKVNFSRRVMDNSYPDIAFTLKKGPHSKDVRCVQKFHRSTFLKNSDLVTLLEELIKNRVLIRIANSYSENYERTRKNSTEICEHHQPNYVFPRFDDFVPPLVHFLLVPSQNSYAIYYFYTFMLS